ncbi:MAG: thermonuclease family protein [Steroidobacteraceae bacterium]|nr:thermonuclease family protein [Steroidobacteraceae bacterium]MBP9129588.1 thermonuclease family protein [Steroidobacteraceae bacterium]
MGSSKRLSVRKQPSLRWILIAAAFFLPAAWSSTHVAARDGDATAVLVGRVTEVTDGDTIHVALASGPIIVRLHSIDTPERAQPWGRQAAAALERRLRQGTEVTLQPITQDEYDRLVAVVYVNDKSVNAWMVQQGHAWAYRQYLDDAQYCAWEQQARVSGLGVWSLPSTKRIAPWEYRKAEREQTQIVMGSTVETETACVAAMNDRGPVTNTAAKPSKPEGPCRIKGNINDKGDRIYHVPGSESYEHTGISASRGERWFCTEEEARKAGWRAPRGNADGSSN